MKTLLLFSAGFFLLALVAHGQAPPTQWQMSYGGNGDDRAYSIVNTVDGGYITAGYTGANGGDVSGYHGGGLDFWVTKISGTGSLQWQKSLGGSSYEDANCIIQTSDGGYLVAGAINSNNGDISGNHGSDDYWLVKLSSAGAIEWQKTYGGTNAEYALSVAQTADGGYIVLGNSNSTNGDITDHHGSTTSDYWVLKLSSTGTIEWSKSYGGTSQEGEGDLEKASETIRQTADGGYIFAGFTYSNDGDISFNHGSNGAQSDYWVVKISATGAIEWQKCYGGSNDDRCHAIKPTSDGGYILAGATQSNNFDVSGNHLATQNDYWIVKISATGTLEWQKCLGGTGNDIARAICQAADGGYMVLGDAGDAGGDITASYAGFNFWLVRLSSTGVLEWQKSYGSNGIDHAFALQATPDGGYIMAGETRQNSGDVTGNHNNSPDFWVIKLNPILLPLKLTGFAAAARGNGSNLLQWTCTNERALKNFEVQSALPGANFQAIGTVQAKNIYTATSSYAFTDKNAGSNNRLYRLKMIDIDGSFSYSPQVLVKGNDLSLQPTFFRTYDQLQVMPARNAEPMELQLYNTAGQLLLAKKTAAGQPCSISITALAAGEYIAVVKTGKTNASYRFIK